MPSVPVSNPSTRQTAFSARGIFRKETKSNDRLRRLGKLAPYALVGAVVFLLAVVFYEFRKFNTAKAAQSRAEAVSSFETECLLRFPSSQFAASGFSAEKYCEGYWASDESAVEKQKLPFPHKGDDVCGKRELVMMMQRLEQLAAELDDDDSATKKSSGEFTAEQKKRARNYALSVARQRGLSPSRLESGVLLGNREFSAGTVCWTGDLAEYYVGKFNVAPSREFVAQLLVVYKEVFAL